MHTTAVLPGSSKRVLVLGGRGFIGSHLVDALLAAGASVRCFDRPNVPGLGDSRISHSNYEYCQGDLASDADVVRALDGCDYCFHLVSTTLPHTSNADPSYDVETNILGTVRLLSQAVKANVKKIVFVSSGGTVYGVPKQVPIPESHPTDPTSSYGIAKLTIEKYLALFKSLHGLDYAALRIANPFGERQRTQASQGAIAVFLGRVLRGEPVEVWGDGSVVRDYIYIADVIDALIRALGDTGNEHIFNIGSGRGHSLNEVLDAIERTTGRVVERRYSPGRSFDVPKSVLDICRAREMMGWVPSTDFDEGLRRFVAWLTESPERWNATR